MTHLAPVVDGVLVVLGRRELSNKAIDNRKVVNHIPRKIAARVSKEVISYDPFVGEDHDDAGGEALVPGVFGHELDEVARSRSREDR